MKTKRIVLWSALLLFLLSSLLGYVVQSDFGFVRIESFTYLTPDGYRINGTFYRPRSATPETPGPAVITCAGGTNEHTAQTFINTELARRGYAVFSFDAFNHGRSDMHITDTMGALDMIHFAAGFTWVDADRLAVEGHSNGGVFLANAALESGMVRSVVYNGVVPYDAEGAPFLSPDTPVNAAFILCRYDEYAGPSNWGVETALDSVRIPRLMFAFGTADEISPDTYYGDAAQQTLRLLVTPSTTHSLACFSGEVIADMAMFLDYSMDYTSRVSPGNQIWGWSALLSGINLLSALLFILLVADAALDWPFFAHLTRHPVVLLPNPRRKLLFAVGCACAFAAFTPLFLLGKSVLQVSLLYPQADSNGVALWAVASGIIYLCLYFLFDRLTPPQYRTAAYNGYAITGKGLSHTFLLALLCFLLFYALSACKFFFFASGLSFLWSSFVPLTLEKVPVSFVYYITFLPFFFCINLLITRFMSSPKKSISILYASLFYTLGIALLLILNTAYVILMHRLPVHAARFSLGAMLYMVALLPFFGGFCAWFYHRTGKLYLASFLNCFLFTWLLVGSNSTFFF